MTLHEFCGTTDYSVTQFAVQLSKEIQDMMSNRTIFYQDQIDRLIERRTSLFLKSLSLSPALASVYKRQILQHILFKIKPVMKQRQLFRIVK
ncbi:hypothetical protein JOC78_000273 [Bacillus ectoiniformans]|uniref:hypothetical protein n=1 Tax=Bacillus ectoiniformans TaxID=1494429 RepID=UPI00195E286E|nr:hypothetical protein [Bacillus ectoiniformans]MBM7647352.1 hypothetical protein [Bacillus ectoiniformans]